MEANTGITSVPVHYGDVLEFKYGNSDIDTSYQFVRWYMAGQGVMGATGDEEHEFLTALSVVGDASLQVHLNLKDVYVLTVYKPAVGDLAVSNGRLMYDYGDYAMYSVRGGDKVVVKYNPDKGGVVYVWYNNDSPFGGRQSITINGMDKNRTVMPFLTLDGMSYLDSRYYTVVQNDEGAYRLPAMSGLEQCDAHVSASEGQIGSEWTDEGLVLTLSGISDVRGNVPVTVTLDGKWGASQFRVHVFVVGPVVDGRT